MPLLAESVLPAQATIESISRTLLLLVSIVLVALLGGIIRGLFYTTVVGDTDTTNSESKHNCPNCGARIREQSTECDHCGEPLAV